MAETDDGNTVTLLMSVADAWRIATALAVWRDSLHADIADLPRNADAVAETLRHDIERAELLRDRIKLHLITARKH